MSEILEPLHLLILGFIAWNILKADHLGFSWIRGSTKTLDTKEVKKYHYRISIGLGLMVVTGLLLFWPMREYLLTRPQFYVKMTFVVTLIVNSFVIAYLQKIPTVKSFSSLSPQEKLPLFISGGISTAFWILTAVAGLYLIPE
jgi:uncharacterized membrane protein